MGVLMSYKKEDNKERSSECNYKSNSYEQMPKYMPQMQMPQMQMPQMQMPREIIILACTAQ